MADSVMGVEDVQEAIAGLNELALALIPLVKDGIQLSDAVSLAARIQSDEALRGVIAKAVDGIGRCGPQLKDLQLAEGLSLAQAQLGFLPRYIEALKA